MLKPGFLFARLSMSILPTPSLRARTVNARLWYARLKKTRYLLLLRARARRLTLRNRVQLGAQSDAARVRRLHQHILALCHEDVASDTDGALLSVSVARVVREQLRSVGGELMRRSTSVLLGTLALGLLGLIVTVSVPPLRHRWFPPDLGRRAHWTATSHFPGTPQKGLGTAPALNKPDGTAAPFFVHTLHEQDPYIDLEFGRPVRVRTVRIENRSDCCSERALPLNVEIPGSPHPRILCQRRSPFQEWTCSVQNVTTRRLRIRRPGTTMLHLRRIEVFE